MVPSFSIFRQNGGIMEYLELLEEIRSAIQSLRVANHRLEAVWAKSHGLHTAIRVARKDGRHSDPTAKSAVDSVECQDGRDQAQAHLEALRDQAFSMIRAAGNPDLMKALYWRQINNFSWYEISKRLENRHTPVALRQAASRYMRAHSETTVEEVALG
jgi:hypothetical protein